MSILKKLEGFGKPFKIYADTNTIEQPALEQFVSAMEQDFVVQGSLMPDAHLGYSLPIGGVVKTTPYCVVPAYVGYDIGCGVCAVKTDIRYSDLMSHRIKIKDTIYDNIPVGFNKRPASPAQSGDIKTMLADVSGAMYRIYNEKQGHLQLGTLGGGNHFIEIGVSDGDCEPDEGSIWIIIHSGSRGVGHGCATHYMKAASPTGKASEGHFPLDTGTEVGANYVRDMNFCLEYALWNRKVMLFQIIDILRGLVGYGDIVGDIINRNHNHAEWVGDGWVHRKGATHADEGMMGVIPGNMRDGSFIVRGKGNPESLNSSSHGAGRVLGRKKAKQTLNLEDFENTMKGILAPVDRFRLDESPSAYKNIFDVMDLQKDLVDVVDHERPLIVIKG
jgi:tRNA-splicing ligase RtcB